MTIPLLSRHRQEVHTSAAKIHPFPPPTCPKLPPLRPQNLSARKDSGAACISHHHKEPCTTRTLFGIRALEVTSAGFCLFNISLPSQFTISMSELEKGRKHCQGAGRTSWFCTLNHQLCISQVPMLSQHIFFFELMDLNMEGFLKSTTTSYSSINNNSVYVALT